MGILEMERHGGRVTLTLNRPERRNALNGQLWDALRRATLDLTDRPPRVVIITGAGDHFSAGMDLSMDNSLIGDLIPAVANQDRMRIRELILKLKLVFSGIARLNCPVIAAIEGACIGGGLELALACDVRVASIESVFSLPETRLGMVPDVGGTVRLTRLVGQSRATEMILTGRTVEADEALSMGIVTRVAPPKGALNLANEIADQILSASPAATHQTLLALRRVASLPDDEAFELETEAGVRAITAGDLTEGLEAFHEKRAPQWNG